MTRRGLVAVALSLVAVTVAGCATMPDDTGWTPPGSGPAAEVQFLDSLPEGPTDVPGLQTRLLYSADDASPVVARWAEVPGATGLNDELRGRVRAAMDAQTAATGVPWTPRADAPAESAGVRGCVPGSGGRPAAELLADPVTAAQGVGPSLVVVCEIVGAGSTVLAQRLRVVTGTPAGVTSDTATTLFLETSGAWVEPSTVLLSEQGLPALFRLVVEGLKARTGALFPEMREDPSALPLDQLRATFADARFAANGALVVSLPRDFSTVELERLGYVADPATPLIASVPAVRATELLTPRGAEIQTALSSASPLVVPPAPYAGEEVVDCDFFACVSLTFDDGPGAYTGRVLDDLLARRAAATFYVQGINVSRNGALVARIDDEGHELGNHTWSHPELTTLPDPEVKSQLDRTAAAVAAITGTRMPTFRPPYGDIDDRVLAAAGEPAVLWSDDTLDWQKPADDVFLQRAVVNPEPGAIILCHDVHENTARMVPAIIDGLQARGFTLVTLDQLYGGDPPTGAIRVTRGP